MKLTLVSLPWKAFLAAHVTVAILLAASALCEPARASIVYAGGFGLPEQIVAATSNSGFPAGTLLVVDASTAANNGIASVYSIPPGGGTPQLVASLPSGDNAYAASFAANGSLVVYGFNNSGAASFILSPGSTTFNLAYADPNSNSSEYVVQAVTAPAGFGSVAGNTLIGEEFDTGSTSTVEAFSSSGTPTVFATINNFVPGQNYNATGPGGLVFSSSGFIPGTTGPDLLVNDYQSGIIDSIDSSGNVNYFTTIPLIDGQAGLRQMAVAPDGFGAYGGDLLVSVAALNGGGGTFGAVYIVNGEGNIVATLSQGVLGAALDPRGLYFESNSELLIANADPSIYGVSATDFSAVPEPGTFGAMLLALGLGAICFRVRGWVSVRTKTAFGTN